MSRYHGPKAKINRRLGVNVYDSNGALRAARKRPTAPGEHPWRNRKPSEYGLGLIQKQALKHYYGLHERQLRRFYDQAKRSKGNVAARLIELCERRLDNLIWRSGLARTRAQARQAVAHGHFTVNGHRAHARSALLRMGDVIAVSARPNLQTLYTRIAEENDRPADDCAVREGLSFRIARLPTHKDCTLDVHVDKIIEFLNR